jgi:hypothetical protein
MLRILAILVGVVLLIGAAPAAFADGPFGIAAGTELATLDVARPGTHGQYDLGSVPEPDELFVRYGVQAAEGVGVCQVSALTRSFAGVGEVGVAARYRQVAGTISRRYGKPSYSHPQEHLQALPFDPEPVLGNRMSSYGDFWDNGDDLVFADGVDIASLELVSIDNSHFAFIASFTFANQRDCLAAWQEGGYRARTPQTCWIAVEHRQFDPDESGEQSLCFDGHGKVTATSVYRGPDGAEAMEAGGRYWGRHGRIHFSGEGDAWPWQWQEVACDLSETATGARLSHCEGVTKLRYNLEVEAPPADMRFVVER